MSVLLEGEFQLGIDGIGGLFNDALKTLRAHTPAEGYNIPRFDLQAMQKEIAPWTEKLKIAIDKQYEINKVLPGTSDSLELENPGYGSQFLDYDPQGWYSANVPRFVINLKSPRFGARFECKDSDYQTSAGGYMQGLTRVRIVEIVSGVIGGGRMFINTLAGSVYYLKWENIAPDYSFKNIREVTLPY